MYLNGPSGTQNIPHLHPFQLEYRSQHEASRMLLDAMFKPLNQVLTVNGDWTATLWSGN